jgi:hypothetical protein
VRAQRRVIGERGEQLVAQDLQLPQLPVCVVHAQRLVVLSERERRIALASLC